MSYNDPKEPFRLNYSDEFRACIGNDQFMFWKDHLENTFLTNNAPDRLTEWYLQDKFRSWCFLADNDKFSCCSLLIDCFNNTDYYK